MPLRAAAATCLTMAGIGCVATSAAAQELAAGPGSDLVARACSNCHSIDNVLQVRKTRADWDTTVHLMVNYGMQMSDGDMKIAIDYLSSYYGFQARPPSK
jgi:cytochrome c5